MKPTTRYLDDGIPTQPLASLAERESKIIVTLYFVCQCVLTFKRLALLIAEKQQQDYNKTIARIRWVSFLLVRSSVMCLRGARSSYHRPTKPDFDTPLDVALSDGHMTAPYGPFL